MSKSIKLNPDLWRRVEQCVQKAGYSSAQEFLEHVVEKELTRLEEEEAREDVARRFKGLGYLE